MEVHEIITLYGAIKTHFKRAVRMYAFPYDLANKPIAAVNHYHPMLSESLVATPVLRLRKAGTDVSNHCTE
jgi:hypothetical protein